MIPEWMDSWYFIGGMFVLLCALIAVYFVVKGKGGEGE
jgi:hypothetical protein